MKRITVTFILLAAWWTTNTALAQPAHSVAWPKDKIEEFKRLCPSADYLTGLHYFDKKEITYKGATYYVRPFMNASYYLQKKEIVPSYTIINLYDDTSKDLADIDSMSLESLIYNTKKEKKSKSFRIWSTKKSIKANGMQALIFVTTVQGLPEDKRLCLKFKLRYNFFDPSKSKYKACLKEIKEKDLEKYRYKHERRVHEENRFADVNGGGKQCADLMRSGKPIRYFSGTKITHISE